MLKLSFYELNTIDDNKLDFAVIACRYNKKWIYVKHKKRNTWEIPGGHKETNENIDTAAKRELYEETGAKKFDLYPICIYSVDRENDKSYGQLYYADVYCFGNLPDYEIEKIKLFDSIPSNLTYPLIQPTLLEKVKQFGVIK
ncbi:NUDIX hydrolase [Clostridium bornimense]|uniref:NUDIX hydrolase n=1 Tax=Clostridium bornimense TaxID=1216932 RepID=W6RUS9_9CLOT|nr:NUDIX domain-containing protein [Clostridium bornimense]CDM68406.1 NUDIX hydrolase [Clostridium bornimense]